jgi:phosphoketolase
MSAIRTRTEPPPRACALPDFRDFAVGLEARHDLREAARVLGTFLPGRLEDEAVPDRGPDGTASNRLQALRRQALTGRQVLPGERPHPTAA